MRSPARAGDGVPRPADRVRPARPRKARRPPARPPHQHRQDSLNRWDAFCVSQD